MTAYQLTVFTHVAFGSVALLSYWVAALARKGSAPHKLAGKVYVLVMAVVLLAAIPLGLRVLLERSVLFGVFLFYLVLITITALSQGWFATRNKRNFPGYAGPVFRRMAWANIIGGAVVLGLGAQTAQPILLGFSLVGILGGRSMLRLAERGPTHPRWWMEEHLGAMLGCGVATHIAFLQIGLPRLLPALAGPNLQMAAWLAPLAVALLARIWLGRKYLPVAAAPAGAAGQVTRA